MGELKNPKLAIPVVLMAGIFWSFGPYVVRNIDEAGSVPWQYLFTRGLVIFILLNLYLFMEEGIEFINNYKKNRYIRFYWWMWFSFCNDCIYLVNN